MAQTIPSGDLSASQPIAAHTQFRNRNRGITGSEEPQLRNALFNRLAPITYFAAVIELFALAANTFAHGRETKASAEEKTILCSS